VLDVSLHGVTFRHLHDVTLTLEAGSHTAIAGPPASGASTLLSLIAGDARPARGSIQIGRRDVTRIGRERRPLLYASREADFPRRWSVQHALIAAVRRRSLDRIDRLRELELATEKWGLETLLERRAGTLSDSEAARLRCARIELLRPAILVADRVLEGAPSTLAGMLFRTLRVSGTTVITAPASHRELGFTDRVVILENGTIAQSGTAAEVYAHPASEAAAAATGEVNIIPLTLRGTTASSIIGTWETTTAGFEGNGVALARPEDFSLATAGEESDLILGVEEASFAEGRWLVDGILTGAVSLRVSLPGAARLHKGKLLPLRYDPARFTLLPLPGAVPPMPDDAVPPMRETR
jgi:ABC-type Fe3+/spermidine/putrescine transport system ATPase subunit